MTTFDENVIRAMDKWPNVPNCTGWLSLDRRGCWRLQGELIRHPRTISFFNRHYASDECGRWFVQNGPQRVFVDLTGAPFGVWLEHPPQLVTHTGVPLTALSSLIVTDTGDLYLESAVGLGLLSDRDLAAFVSQLKNHGDDAAEVLTQTLACDTAIAYSRVLTWYGRPLRVRRIIERTLPAEFGFIREPRGL